MFSSRVIPGDNGTGFSIVVGGTGMGMGRGIPPWIWPSPFPSCPSHDEFHNYCLLTKWPINTHPTPLASHSRCRYGFSHSDFHCGHGFSHPHSRWGHGSPIPIPTLFPPTSQWHAHTHLYRTITGIILSLGSDDGKNQISWRALLWFFQRERTRLLPTQPHNKHSKGDGGAHCGGCTAEPLPQPGRSLVINGVAVESVRCCGAGRNRQTSGIWKHVVEFTPAMKGRLTACIPPVFRWLDPHIPQYNLPLCPHYRPVCPHGFPHISPMLPTPPLYDTLVPSHPVGVTFDSHIANTSFPSHSHPK